MIRSHRLVCLSLVLISVGVSACEVTKGSLPPLPTPVGTVRLQGHVSDTSGKTLSGIDIRITAGTKNIGMHQNTDAFGNYEMFVVPEQLALEASATGFQLQRRDANVVADTTITFMLARN